MNKRRRFFLIVFICHCLGALLWWWYQRTPLNEIKSFDGEKAVSGIEANALEETVGLVIQSINLFQGREGMELWRLKASWAHIAQEGDVINVDAPHMLYALGGTGLPAASAPTAASDASPTPAAAQPDPSRAGADPSKDNADAARADVLDVTAQKGRISDRQKHLRLWNDVIIERLGDTIRAPRLDYDSTTRIMVFPEGATFHSPRGTGRMPRLSWDLKHNVITASGGVEIVIAPRHPAPPASDADQPSSGIKAPESDSPKPDSPSPGTPEPAAPKPDTSQQNLSSEKNS